MAGGIYNYWGKAAKDYSSWHLLPYHCLDVAAVGFSYLRSDDLLCRRIENLAGIPAERIPGFIAFFLALHDLGKFSESFQGQIPTIYSTLQGRQAGPAVKVPHTTIGKVMWDRNIGTSVFQERLFKGEELRNLVHIRISLSPFLNAIFGHHGIPPETQNIDWKQVYSQEDSASAKDFVFSVLDLLSIDGEIMKTLARREKSESLKILSWPLAGLAVLADWIASNSRFFPYYPERMTLEHYWEKTLPRAEAALRSIGILPLPASPQRGIAHLFPEFGSGLYTPSDLQEYASRIRPGPGPHLFIIEEATGSGKTEAALTLAHQLMADGCSHGFYFALPTMATSNAMHERILKVKGNFFEGEKDPPVILAHSAWQLSRHFLPGESSGTENLLGDDDKAPDVTCWLEDNRKKALLAPLGVGTIDQALISVLPRRHQSLRLFGLWRNVLIVDEVHAYDPYVHELLRNLICDHARIGGSTILLSATLPTSTRNELAKAFCEGAGIPYQAGCSGPYPLVTHVSPLGIEEIPVHIRPGMEREIRVEFFDNEGHVIDALLSVAKAGRCACWIRNTVRDAFDASRKLQERAQNCAEVILFHARYVLGHRLEREEEIIRLFGKKSTEDMRAGKILVATQVVEQSLDLDFDYMITDLAPIDLVIQRSGRLHRHRRGERGSPILGIHAPGWSDEPAEDWFSSKFPRASWVYPAHGDLWLTCKILMEKGAIRVPSEARSLVEGVYGPDAKTRIPESLARRDASFRKDHESRGLAMTNVIRFLSGYQATEQSWTEDEAVPTRLAEPSVTLRIGVVDDGHKTLRPLFEDGEYSCLTSH
jgi:CRISPR-associated endonuclease/helicase Cas3